MIPGMNRAVSLLLLLLIGAAWAQAPRADERKASFANTKVIYIDSHTHFVKQAEMEKALLKQKDFEAFGLELTRDQRAADVILEVKRAAFQNNFPYSVIDRRTKVVLAAGEVNSLGGTAYGKIATQFMEKLKAAREKAGVK
jgi:hypothetical protein